MKTIVISSANVSFRSNDLDKYLNDIRQYKPLSVEDERMYLTMAHNGNKKAAQNIINANLLIVVSVAKYYQGMGLDLLDLINEGNIGLCKAVDDFDLSTNYKFISFAVPYIRTEIRNAISDKGRLVRLPLNEIKKKTYNSAISMNTPLGGNDEGEHEKTLLDTFASDTTADTFSRQHDMEIKVKSLLKGLPEREKIIICKLFGIGCREQNEWEVAENFGLCEERVRQIKWSAIEKMKEFAKK